MNYGCPQGGDVVTCSLEISHKNGLEGKQHACQVEDDMQSIANVTNKHVGTYPLLFEEHLESFGVPTTLFEAHFGNCINQIVRTTGFAKALSL